MSLEAASLAILLAMCLGLVLYWHVSKRSPVDLRELLIDRDTGKTSLNKIGQLVALVFSTWVFLREATQDRMTEWLFAGYMLAWAGANLASKWTPKPPEQPK